MFQVSTKEILRSIESQKVLVIGETIKDVFIPVEYQGNSMKSFCTVVKEVQHEEPCIQIGGAAVIQRHLSDFVDTVDLISNSKEEIIKTRYYDIQRHITHFELSSITLKSFSSSFDVNYDFYDIVIVADFGHGFINSLNQHNNMSFMAQTNSQNFGYNRISKWKDFKKRYVCVDNREAKLHMNNNLPINTDIVDLYNYETNTQQLTITDGKNGGCFYNGLKKFKYEAHQREVYVDSIGAGDAFFAFSSVFLGNEYGDVQEKLNLASIFASFTTEWRGNKSAITKSLLKLKNVL